MKLKQAKDGRFELLNWGDGRNIRVFAFYDGTKDGKPVRFLSRTEKLILRDDIGPLTITLDRHEQKP